ncbi:hypothetical protein EDC04DRAFT_2612479 [Pisolithus marmoratus]|nr:hypothetical protein EDC04DRAFT_2612479 [Pisolithus marmoratus]
MIQIGSFVERREIELSIGDVVTVFKSVCIGLQDVASKAENSEIQTVMGNLPARSSRRRIIQLCGLGITRMIFTLGSTARFLHPTDAKPRDFIELGNAPTPNSQQGVTGTPEDETGSAKFEACIRLQLRA